MSRKDYELIARTVKGARLMTAERKRLAENFAEELEKDNDRFDRERFIRACGVRP